MSRPRTPGLLTDYQVSCIRALAGAGTSRRLVEYVQEVVAEHRVDWPARAYVFGTWGYALSRAIELATRQSQKTYLYAGVLDGEPVWVVGWDPKP